MTDLQKRTAQAIVNVFETGSVKGDYANVTVVAGDNGHLTYGRSQTTLASGNLYLLIEDYCSAANAVHADTLRPYLQRLKNRDLSLDHDATLRATLRTAGKDPVMMSIQDAFFDRVYWMPAVNAAANIGLSTPLGVAIVYDSTVHGSWKAMRDRTIQNHGQPAGNERAWLGHYVATRRAWLAGKGGLLAKTVYRMDTFKALLDAGNMNIALPVVAHGVQITEANLGGEHAVIVSAHDDDDVILRLTNPHMTGESVRALQLALIAEGAAIQSDGDFGPKTESAVITAQKKHHLKPDGIVGPATRHALGMDKVHT